MNGAQGAMLGVLGTVLVLGVFYLMRTIYRQGNEWAKFQIKKVWYRIKYKARWKPCVTCNGKGSYIFSGGIEGMSNTIVGGAPLDWECGYCDGTGYEKASYTYRFGRLMKLFRVTKTPIQFENDQRDAEKVLGDARAKLTTAPGVKPEKPDDKQTSRDFR